MVVDGHITSENVGFSQVPFNTKKKYYVLPCREMSCFSGGRVFKRGGLRGYLGKCNEK